MIRVLLTPRIRTTAERLGPEITSEANRVIAAVAKSFGQPHQHSGIGLRKLGRRSYEARLGLQWRIVFVRTGDSLTAYDIMDHAEVRRWLKGRR